MSGRRFDHGELNIPGRLKNLDREIDRHLAEQAREGRKQARLDIAQRKADREAEKAAEAARVKFTAADLADAIAVRDRWGWHRVARVSAKSVTVETAYSWTERIPLANVLEAKP
ncbi:hypothetical protein [Nocardioides aurantiacus]|uniref:Uncharacterized protein n=1 Tax=Nocardioides aurantiacus TaxID=86796 RepID=A0A3N2CW02_9ACTN|nr:hypothetical protein [Nocardioides aurantiacus]ROR91725.1 hypothetical protein EDD33_2600 [Nocardioides aurantiacus]